MNSRTVCLSSSRPRSPISTRFGTVMFIVELVHLPLPAGRPRDAGVHGQPVDRLGVPVGVEADHPHVSSRALSDGLGDRVRPARRVLADDDGDGADLQHLVQPSPRRRPGPEGWFSTVGLSFASGGIRASPKSTTRRCSEQVEVEVRDVARPVADRLLAHALGAGQPLALPDARVLAPAGHVQGADDHRVGPPQVGRRRRQWQPHERGHVLVDEGEEPGAGEVGVADVGPVG
jgi:hypothetical protein